MKKAFAALGGLLVVVPLYAPAAKARDLSFDDRVKAQEAIERVYYSYQIGTKTPFKEAVPRTLLEQKVRTYLQQSVALEAFWHTPVTAQMLLREMERQARQTRMPERLRQLYIALDNDPFLVAECVARPILVDRLTRNFFAQDERIHEGAKSVAELLKSDLERDGLTAFATDPRKHDIEIVRVDSQDTSHPEANKRRGASREILLSSREFARWRGHAPFPVGKIWAVREKREAFEIEVVTEETPDRSRITKFTVQKSLWDDWWRTVSEGIDPETVDAVGRDVENLPAAAVGLGTARRLDDALAPSEGDMWDNGSLDDVPDPRSDHTVVWTGTYMVVWGGSPVQNTGGRYDPATDTWLQTSTVGAPSGRDDHTAVWTGSEMIVWGGEGSSGELNTGGRYDPASNTWTPMSTAGAPAARANHTAVWTGTSMVVWGGSYLDTGGRYNPTADTWTPTSTVGVPLARSYHTAVWTGKWMVVWGGDTGFPTYETNTGGRYDPIKDRWAPTSAAAPSVRGYHTAIWTGNEMIVWGGWGGKYRVTGGRYDPVADRWKPTAVINAPQRRADHVAVWTGTRMVVWGGNTPPDSYPGNTGGQYDPTTDTWEPTSTVSAPPGASNCAAIWTGEVMIVWGGSDGRYPLNSGGRYDPAHDMWTPTSNGGAPTARIRHTAVWTGSEMIIWGGEGPSGDLNSGSRYDPATDHWTPTATDRAPSAREFHTTVWTGTEMIVWGGSGEVFYLETGGRYDPIADRWVRTSRVNTPAARLYHTAVWTGNEMIVWGGAGSSGKLETGGRYDPSTNTWMPTSAVGVPSPRTDHAAVWTGEWMIVWGGDTGFPSYETNTGGRYDPLTNTWMPTSTSQAPSRRRDQTAIWTGSRMIIWGGWLYDGTSQYFDTGGQYDPTTDAWVPTSQENAPTGRATDGIWTGTLMIVWGGDGSSGFLNSGGRYDPATDTWTPMSGENAPSARAVHTTVWSDSRVVVWGGLGSGFLSSGGSYAP